MTKHFTDNLTVKVDNHQHGNDVGKSENRPDKQTIIKSTCQVVKRAGS